MSHDDPAFAAQRALSGHIRDPLQADGPNGIEDRRLKIYRELFFNNVEGMLAGNFPVIVRTLGEDRWQALVRDFYREHPSHTPLFTELAREFLRYLETRAEQDRGDAPWLQELAHYEWVELALQISEARASDVPHDPEGDLLTQAPVLSPLAWPLAYEWPVHRIGPGLVPTQPPGTPTLLLVQRGADGSVRFSELSPLTFRLLQRIEAEPALSGRAQLQALAVEAGAPEHEAFIAMGHAMLEQLRNDGALLGSRA
ncbi:MAG: FIG005107: hypothetical protein [uncultured Lysobacter sp.]|uniref:Uncharacterized protein n=1 Tax=uncultured Lysobacter sp. TaxID=271060 RepID=A0A6J4LUU9_9GAMM|nr:MAG: FIG005107: hypothetical protein [uncultured Lysobacter sp.]